ncbi:MAG TPA: hypothetical protein VGK45_18550, partial [Thermoanaerobaculia bacterium]
MDQHEIDLAGPPEAALEAVGRAADAWGAELERQGLGGRLRLPIVAGLRRGLLAGPLSVEETAKGSRVVFQPDESAQAVQMAPLLLLLLAGAGSVLTILWPFYPQLLPLAPFGAVVALGGWFLVISRLRTSGPQEFLAMVAAQAEGAESPG